MKKRGARPNENAIVLVWQSRRAEVAWASGGDRQKVASGRLKIGMTFTLGLAPYRYDVQLTDQTGKSVLHRQARALVIR